MALDDRPSRPRSFGGRPLLRPDQEIVDQGLGFDLDTLVGRRGMLRAFGLAATAVGLAACGAGSGGSTASTAPAVSVPTTAGARPSSAPAGESVSTRPSRPASASPSGSASAASSLTEIPGEMTGPFPSDGNNGPDVLEQSGIVRSDIRASFGGPHAVAAGVPLTLELQLRNLAKGGAPYAGVAVYVWQCDRDGKYSMYDTSIKKQNYLRGVQIAGADGTVRFTSIFPGCYTGRWPHIHFEVYPDRRHVTDFDSVLAISQIAMPAQACARTYTQPGYEDAKHNFANVSLAGDMVFQDDLAVHETATVTGSVRGGFTARLPVAIDPTTPLTGGYFGGTASNIPGGAGFSAPPTTAPSLTVSY